MASRKITYDFLLPADSLNQHRNCPGYQTNPNFSACLDKTGLNDHRRGHIEPLRLNTGFGKRESLVG